MTTAVELRDYLDKELSACLDRACEMHADGDFASMKQLLSEAELMAGILIKALELKD